MRLFAAPPGDDQALLDQADQQLAAGEGRGGDWPGLVAELGIDGATAIYYRRTRSRAENRALIQSLEQGPEGRMATALPGLVLVPGFLHESRPELGADGALVVAIARRLGLAIERAPTLGHVPLSENAACLRDYFAKRPATPAWVLSLSRGTSDLAWGLREAEPMPWPGIIGWVNLCGAPHGSALVAAYRSGWRWGLGQALRLRLGVPDRTLREYASDQAHWRRPLVLPDGLRVINIVACPLRWHLGRAVASEHALLAPLGPNDGVTLCAQAELPGETFPLWGADHYFRAPQVVPLLERLLRYLCLASPS